MNAILDRFQHVHALVVGDAMIDMYHFGKCIGLSAEAPVPIFVDTYAEHDARRGGADNVAHQLEALGCKVTTRFPPKRSVKHRYFVDHHLVFRRDSDQIAEPRWLDAVLEDVVTSDLDVIVLSDYDKGALFPDLCRLIIAEARRHSILVVADPKRPDWEKFDGVDYLCPNEHEYAEWLRSASTHRWRRQPPTLLVKRSVAGIDVVINGSVAANFPAQTQAVFDVTGAGDVVAAVVAATVASDGSPGEAATLANLAAGYTVSRIGTTVCPLAKLRELVG